MNGTNNHIRYDSSGANLGQSIGLPDDAHSNKKYQNTPPSNHHEYVPQSYGSSGVFADTERLRQDLELEQMESSNLDRQLRETRKKLENSLELQSQLENDVVSMAKEVAILQSQIKDLKKSNHSLESELSQEQVNNLNEKQQWLDKEQEFEKTIKRLKEENIKFKKIATEHSKMLPPTIEEPDEADTSNNTYKQPQQSTNHNRYFSMHSFASLTGFGSSNSSTLPSSASSASSSPSSVTSTATNFTAMTSYSNQSPITSSFSGSQPGPAPSSSVLAAKDKTIERLKMELEQLKQQTELLSREYTIRHNQIEAEVAQQKTLVTKLMEENEGFQYLLAEKAILGGFSSDAEYSDSESHLRKKRHHYGRRHHDHNNHKHAGEQEPKKELEKKEGTLTRSEIKSIHTSNSLADELERATLANSEESEDSDSSEDSVSAKKKIYDLEFEVRTLNNHNKALSLSLERLVHRLLEFKQFEHEVETSTMSGSINAASISQFQNRVSSSSASVRSNSAGSVGKRYNNGLLPVSSPFTRNGYSSNNGSNTQLNLQPTTSNSSFTQQGNGHSVNNSVYLGKQHRHIARDSVSSTTSSLFGKSTRSLKNPSMWNNMLLGGSSPGCGVGTMGFGFAAAGSRLSMLSASSLPFTQSGSNMHSPTLSEIHLGIDGDTSPSSGGSEQTSRSNSSDAGANNLVYNSAHRGANGQAGHHHRAGSVISGLSELQDTRLELSHNHVNGSSASSVVSTEDLVLPEVAEALQDVPAHRRPSTNSQRSLRPLSIYAHNS